MAQRDEKMEPEKDEREMTDPNLTELPVEKEYSENINRQMRVPDKIRFVHSINLLCLHNPPNGSMGRHKGVRK